MQREILSRFCKPRRRRTGKSFVFPQALECLEIRLNPSTYIISDGVFNRV